MPASLEVPSTVHTSTVRIVPCSLAGSRVSFDIADITAFAEAAMVHKGGDRPIAGWIESRGQRVPVYSLAERLGLAPDAVLGEVALILKRGAEPIAVSVDGVSQPADVSASDLYPLPPAADPSLQNLVRSVLWHQDGLWLHMDASRLAGRPVEPAAPFRPPAAQRPAPFGAAAQTSGAIFAFAVPSINPGDRDVLFAVSARQVLEILEDARAIPVPGAPAHVRGLIAWRQRPVPFIDLGRILGWAPNPREKTAVVVVRGARLPETLALPIATGAGTFRLPFPHTGSTEAAPALPQGVASVVVEVDRTIVCVLDVDALLRPVVSAA